MAKNIKLNATKRVAHGSGEARRVRRAGGIPAALSRLSRETDTIQLNAHEYMMAMRNEVSDQVLVELALDGANIHALLREVQRDVMTGEPIHADFSEVDMNKKIRASVLVRLSGEPVGVAVGGGILSQATHEIEVECLPADLVDAIEVDVTGLQLGDVITGAPIHADFSEVDMTKKIRAAAMLHLVGEPEGVRNQGGVLSQTTHEIQIECLPTDLVESFDVDVSDLKLGDSITVADLKLGDAYTVLTHGDTQVASVSEVKEEEEPAPAAEGEEPAAPEVLSKGKKEEEPAPDAKADAKAKK